MAGSIGRLKALKVENEKRPGLYHDGGGLYLQVTSGGASWVYRYMLRGKAREMGLGPLQLYGLKEARERAMDARRLRHSGVDPIDARKAARAAERTNAAKAISFKRCADGYVKAHRPSWKNAKHAAQWQATLSTYADPVIGAVPVEMIDTSLLMKVFEQDVRNKLDGTVTSLWLARPETASRLRGRIESILDWAKVRGLRHGENPARWRGHLDKLLPAQSKIRKVEHHAALPYKELSGFIARLRQQDGAAARALEFAILTAARTGEVIGARWDEIDLKERLWSIPSSRMKTGTMHRVPLSIAALQVLKRVGDKGQTEFEEPDAFVFSGARGRAHSNMALLMLLRRMNRSDLTVHGFRSTFRDWAADCTTFAGEVVEMALAHTVGNKVEAAYRRSDLLERRRLIMDEWANYCAADHTELSR